MDLLGEGIDLRIELLNGADQQGDQAVVGNRLLVLQTTIHIGECVDDVRQNRLELLREEAKLLVTRVDALTAIHPVVEHGADLLHNVQGVTDLHDILLEAGIRGGHERVRRNLVGDREGCNTSTAAEGIAHAADLRGDTDTKAEFGGRRTARLGGDARRQRRLGGRRTRLL